jgi:anthranilate synthase component 2
MILVVDNYDSFTFNLVHMLEAAGAGVEVVRNDRASVEELLARRPRGIVLSPGPGRPEDAGLCPELVARRPAVPVLGVCLGFQVLGIAFGGVVERSPDLMHGKTSWVRHDGRGLFAGLPDPFEATRYHSLELRQSDLPSELEPSAWSDSGTLMGLRHRSLPYEGVQFHPESVLTVDGGRLLRNFVSRAAAPATGRS